ncbi:helix-turn-helix transcriptional regulator [Niveibacterium sp. SC-1]|uniref:AraC family transcriptional regulator n=1 Tax=Niveibacterium sp. SC-1 TaxID=3135646 RepID=UPI00311EB715
MPLIHRPQVAQFDRSELPVTALAVDYAAGDETALHEHPHAQLLHAEHGVMVVSTEHGQWVVPPTRGLWMPAGMPHAVRMVGPVRMRTAFVRPDAADELPQDCAVLVISPLMRELILAAIEVQLPYPADSRDGRLMRLLLDEIKTSQTLPLHLPRPEDRRLLKVCDALLAQPDDTRSVQDWAALADMDARTLQRRFARETGMRFGQWRQQARLLIALQRLAAGDRVIQVALDLGYSSPGAFATMFKRQFGVSPSAYFR